MRISLFAALAAVLLSFFSFPAVAAGELVIGSNGEVRVESSDLVWERTGVMVSDEAAKYPDAVLKAYRGDPGTPVSVRTETEFKTNGILYVTKVETARLGVRYDADARLVDVVEVDVILATTKILNLSLVLLGMAVVLMMVANILTIIISATDSASALAILASALATLASFSFVLVGFVSFAAVFAVLAAGGAAFGAAAVGAREKKCFVWASAVFYGFAVASAISFFVL